MRDGGQRGRWCLTGQPVWQFLAHTPPLRNQHRSITFSGPLVQQLADPRMAGCTAITGAGCTFDFPNRRETAHFNRIGDRAETNPETTTNQLVVGQIRMVRVIGKLHRLVSPRSNLQARHGVENESQLHELLLPSVPASSPNPARSVPPRNLGGSPSYTPAKSLPKIGTIPIHPPELIHARRLRQR